MPGVEFDLSPPDLALVRAAEEAVSQHGDGRNHTVAAAVRGDGGCVITGLNVYHFTGGPCAELVAIGSAVAAGAPSLEAIVAVADAGRGVVNPCGRCRQVLLDYYPDIRVVVSAGLVVRAERVADLLPWGNRWDRGSGVQPHSSRQ